MTAIEAALKKVREFRWPSRASAVPDAIERLLADDPEERLDALLNIQIDVADQDVIDGLTARAFPLLFELATHADNAGGPALLRWMVDLVLGDHSEWLGMGFHAKKGEGKTFLAGSGNEHVRACYRALVDGREACLDMLSRDSSEARVVGAFALGWLGQVADELVAPMRDALADEDDAATRASLLAALGHLGRHRGAEEVRPVLAAARDDADADVALAATWGDVALLGPAPLTRSLVEALIDAFQGPAEVRWGEAYPWALRSHAAILPQLQRALDGDHRQQVVAALLKAVGSGPEKGQVAALVLGRHLLGRAPDGSSFSDEQRRLLDPLVEQPWVERSPILGDLGLPSVDDLRVELGKERRGPASPLDVSMAVHGEEGSLRDLWKRAATSDVPAPGALVDAILDSTLDPWACLFEGRFLDPQPLMPGRPVDGHPIAPDLLDAILERRDATSAWEGLEAFAQRAVTDRASLPRPLDTARGLWQAVVEAAARLRPAVMGSSDSVDPLLDVLLAYDHELDRRESKTIRTYLASLTDEERETCVLALMANGSRPGRASPHGHRYADAARTPRVSEAALANMEATVRDGRFGRMNLRTAKQRTEAKAKTASQWAAAIHERSVPRVGELARAPIEVGKHDDRDLFVFMLSELGDVAAGELAALLFDPKKAIRKRALDALSALDREVVFPHLDRLRASKKKEHREALAVLDRE